MSNQEIEPVGDRSSARSALPGARPDCCDLQEANGGVKHGQPVLSSKHDLR